MLIIDKMKMLNPVQNLFGRRNYFLIFMYEKLQQIVANMTDICAHCHNIIIVHIFSHNDLRDSAPFTINPGAGIK